MASFRILHPENGLLNHNLHTGLYEFEHVCFIDAESLEEAFKLAQNDFSESYASLDRRSTSVGDIIVDLDEQVFYMISGIGFIEIPPVVAAHIHMMMQNKQETLRNECELNALENQSPEC